MNKQTKALHEALKELLENSAVITPHDAGYKDDFVDLQVRVADYDAAYELLQKHATDK